MTEQNKKSNKKNTQDSFADKLVKQITENLARVQKLDSEELNRLEEEKRKRLLKALDESEELRS